MDEKEKKKKKVSYWMKNHTVEKDEIFEIIKRVKNWGLMMKSSKHIHPLCTFLKL